MTVDPKTIDYICAQTKAVKERDEARLALEQVKEDRGLLRKSLDLVRAERDDLLQYRECCDELRKLLDLTDTASPRLIFEQVQALKSRGSLRSEANQPTDGDDQPTPKPVTVPIPAESGMAGSVPVFHVLAAERAAHRQELARLLQERDRLSFAANLWDQVRAAANDGRSDRDLLTDVIGRLRGDHPNSDPRYALAHALGLSPLEPLDLLIAKVAEQRTKLKQMTRAVLAMQAAAAEVEAEGDAD